MPFLREEENEHGTGVSFFECNTCGVEYSICPAVPPDKHQDWSMCLSEECDSYDPHRDADVLFMTDKEIAEAKPVVSIDKLRQRRSL